MLRKFPETIAPISFFPAGLSFGYLFFLPIIHPTFHDDVTFWTFFAMLFAILLTSSIISIIKFNNGKYIFEHFSYLLTSNLLFIVSGILFIVLKTDAKHAALFTCVIAAGVVYVSGISYLNIRSEKNERAMRIGMCHAWKLVGVAVTFTLYTIMLNSSSDDAKAQETFYKTLGYVMIGSSGLFIILVAINEFLQRQGIMYNYRDCVDHDNSIANSYCKLFSKHEVIIEPNRSSYGTWKSTENLMTKNQQNFTNLWTFYLMFPKLLGAVVFHFFLFQVTLRFSVEFIDNEWIMLTTVWLMASGSVIGTIILRFLNGGKVYTVTSVISIVSLAVSYVLLKNNRNEAVIALWMFYCLSSVSASIPDSALMEISKIRFNEFALTIGMFIEILPIGVLQFIQKDSYFNDISETNFLTTVIATIVILLFTSLIYQLHMPSTLGKSLLQIQNELLKFPNYFVFHFNTKVTSTTSSNSQRQSQNNIYHSNNWNVFNVANESAGESNDYFEISDRLPDPPVNKTVNYDYNSDILKPTSYIPRVHFIAKSSPPNSNIDSTS